MFDLSDPFGTLKPTWEKMTDKEVATINTKTLSRFYKKTSLCLL